MAGFYDGAILEALRRAERPMRHRDLAALLAPNDRHYVAFNRIGCSLTKLYRDGWLAREKTDGRFWYYSLAPERVTIEAGYTWSDEIGSVRVMAVAEGYAMCRRPGAMPFVRSIKELRDQNP
jgi:hypothetical protein